MRVVVFEDNHTKYSAIKDALISKGVNERGIFRLETVAEFVAISNKNFDLCIIDIRMPGITGGESRSAGPEILQMLDYSGQQKIPVLAITAFGEEADRHRSTFAARGCIIYDFDKPELWQQALDIFLAQAKDRGRYDFIIFTALSKERLGFASDEQIKFESVARYGLDLWDCEVAGRAGTIVLLPRMGLVNATAVVSRVLERYAPEVMAMSGICGGIRGNCELGQLLIADVCWEYQSGKWLDEAFEAEPYQTKLDEGTRAVLSKLLDDGDLLANLEHGFRGKSRPAEVSKPKLAAFTSGSAVIASEKRLKGVEMQHRKVAGIDMEVYGFHRAIELSGQQVKSFSAKVVVDRADMAKDDRLHEYGSYLSARFVLKALPYLLGDQSTVAGLG